MTTSGRSLPPSLPPRGLSRYQAAKYIGISTTKFDDMVKRGDMPSPRKIDSRLVWDLRELDVAFDELPHDNRIEVPATGDEVWDDVRV